MYSQVPIVNIKSMVVTATPRKLKTLWSIDAGKFSNPDNSEWIKNMVIIQEISRNLDKIIKILENDRNTEINT